MKMSAIIGFVLAAVAAAVAVYNVFFGGPNRPHDDAAFVGYAVGSFLPSMLCLIVGLVLWKKARRGSGSPSAAAPQAPPPPGAAAGVDPADAARPAADLGDNAGVRLLLPVGRSGWAIAAGYLGLVSVLIFPAPFALATGIYAIIDIRRNPKKHGMGRAIFGVVMGGLGTLLILLMLFGFLMSAMWG